jgi:hypothetical protein
VILCICNNIREQDVKKQPELINLVGSCCGRCLLDPTVVKISSSFYDAAKKEIR